MRATYNAFLSLLVGAGAISQVFAQSSGFITQVASGASSGFPTMTTVGPFSNDTAILTGTGAALTSTKSLDLAKISIPLPNNYKLPTPTTTGT